MSLLIAIGFIVAGVWGLVQCVQTEGVQVALSITSGATIGLGAVLLRQVLENRR